jgi:hypothetical protein
MVVVEHLVDWACEGYVGLGVVVSCVHLLLRERRDFINRLQSWQPPTQWRVGRSFYDQLRVGLDGLYENRNGAKNWEAYLWG